MSLEKGLPHQDASSFEDVSSSSEHPLPFSLQGFDDRKGRVGELGSETHGMTRCSVNGQLMFQAFPSLPLRLQEILDLPFLYSYRTLHTALLSFLRHGHIALKAIYDTTNHSAVPIPAQQLRIHSPHRAEGQHLPPQAADRTSTKRQATRMEPHGVEMLCTCLLVLGVNSLQLPPLLAVPAYRKQSAFRLGARKSRKDFIVLTREFDGD